MPGSAIESLDVQFGSIGFLDNTEVRLNLASSIYILQPSKFLSNFVSRVKLPYHADKLVII